VAILGRICGLPIIKFKTMECSVKGIEQKKSIPRELQTIVKNPLTTKPFNDVDG